ncbi:cyclic di-GMP phosphodiesterase response regulator RpfG [Abditibacteriota bacterium]|nr:cyclic di-GMP phosphodiesterase response regulator RpfG [Abditibacteriota bacterium]
MQAHRPGDLLIVDGNSQFLTLAATTLNRRGHSVRVCAYASEAREHLENYTFDALLCALDLPDGSGAELCAWTKRHADLANLPVAMLVDADRVAPSSDPVAEIMRDYAPGAPVLGGVLAPDEFIVRPIRPEEFVVRVSALLKMRRYRDEVSNVLNALIAVAEGIEEQDKRARGHCRRLATLSVLLGATAGCDEYQLLSLERAGYLHDIGRAQIPGALLEKVQPLTPRESEIVREHPVLGERLCHGVVALTSVRPIIRHHHERGDGSGYPDHLKEGQIPPLAALFSVVDVFDSMMTWRPYRQPLPRWQALETLRRESEQGFWNRELVELFATQVLPTADEHLRASDVNWPAS